MSIKKLLLLGAGESGKSTLFKQMITLYGKGYDDETRKGFVNVVFNNTIKAMKTLVFQSDRLPANLNTRVLPSHEQSKEYFIGLKLDDPVDETVAKHLKQLWSDPGIQNTYENRALFQLDDSARYFFERIDAVARPDFIPTAQDVLRTRVRTTGIVETHFEIDKNKFSMFDVGGQRTERKKWIHCFENVTAVIFVAAISEYDQVLYEDESVNRMAETLKLFEEICNSRWFQKTAMVLFLNKCDLFKEKLLKVPLNKFFPEFKDGKDYEKACTFMENIFLRRNKTDKEIYVHVTCATDTENIRFVFNAVKDIIIKKSLRDAALM